MYGDEVAETFSTILKIDQNQSVTICILMGAVIVLFALHFIDNHYTNKRIAVLEEKVEELEGEKGE